ncbi:MAG: flagellar basal body rod protein FlgC [Rhodobacteraceae bacterium]|nr:flagellar basal body rod protein FlgC [Paracoccaceae bacterium]
MSDLSSTMAASASGMAAQAARLRLVSENMANADTPGFKRKLVSFEAVNSMMNDNMGVRAGNMQLSQAPLNKVYDPGHPLADGNGYYDGSNIEIMIEIADAREAQRSYEANLRMFDQARQMASSTLELLRR